MRRRTRLSAKGSQRRVVAANGKAAVATAPTETHRRRVPANLRRINDPRINPRIRLAIELAAECRTGQVLRYTRRMLVLPEVAPNESESVQTGSLGQIEIPGAGKEARRGGGPDARAAARRRRRACGLPRQLRRGVEGGTDRGLLPLPGLQDAHARSERAPLDAPSTCQREAALARRRPRRVQDARDGR